MANKIASIINAAAQDLREDNDRAERAEALRKAVQDVEDRAKRLQQISRSVLPKGSCGDAASINAKLAALRKREQEQVQKFLKDHLTVVVVGD